MRAWRRTRRLALLRCLSLEIFRSLVYWWLLPHLKTSSQEGRQQPDPRDPPSCCLFSSLRSNLPPELARLPDAIRESGCSLIYHHRSGTSLAPSSSTWLESLNAEAWYLLFLAPCFCFRDSYFALYWREEGPEWIMYGSDISRCILSYSPKGCQRKLTRWYQSVWLLCLFSGVSKPERKKMEFHVLQH